MRTSVFAWVPMPRMNSIQHAKASDALFSFCTGFRVMCQTVILCWTTLATKVVPLGCDISSYSRPNIKSFPISHKCIGLWRVDELRPTPQVTKVVNDTTPTSASSAKLGLFWDNYIMAITFKKGFKKDSKTFTWQRNTCIHDNNPSIFNFLRSEPISYNIHWGKHCGHWTLIGLLHMEGQSMLHFINASRKDKFATSGDPY